MQVAHERIVAGTAATISATSIDQNGEPAAAVGTVTVGVTRGDGSTVVAAGTATSAGSQTGTYTRALTAAQTGSLDILTATWTDGGDSSTFVTVHEVAGGVYHTVTEARTAERSIDTKFADATVIAARRDVEDEFESICGVAFVPRYTRARVDRVGSTELLLPDPMPRVLRSVRCYTDGSTYTALGAADLAACSLDPSGVVTRIDGGTFPAGIIVAEYEHGHTRPPAEIKRYAIKRLRQVLHEATSAVPSRATSFQIAETGVFRLATAGRYSTGDPDIDGALARWSMRTAGIA